MLDHGLLVLIQSNVKSCAHTRVGAKQLVHWFLGGKGLGIQQGTSVWVGSPKSTHKHVSLKSRGPGGE